MPDWQDLADIKRRLDTQGYVMDFELNAHEHELLGMLAAHGTPIELVRDMNAPPFWAWKEGNDANANRD